MTDQPPIVVPSDPREAQIAAGIRQVGAAAAVIATSFGASALAAKVNIVSTLAPEFASIIVIVGPLVWAAVTALGQDATKRQAQRLASLAANPKVPDDVARLR